jgi:predicted O-linked N-acetylglucosamine transferase (SPINDLY family)
MRTVPESKLIIAGVIEGSGRERIAAGLRAGGVEPARIYFHPRLPKRQFLELISTTDVALDPFPYNGGATTCDCLWMGVPVVTLSGTHGFARSGTSLLNGAGFPDLIASSAQEYVEIAAGLARNPQGRAELRATMRPRIAESALCDTDAFVRRFEESVMDLWRRQCA